MVEFQLGELAEEGPSHSFSYDLGQVGVLLRQRVEQILTSLHSPLADLTAERQDRDRLRGIFPQHPGNKNLPLGVQFINPVHDVLGSYRCTSAKDSCERQEGWNSERFLTGK